MAVMYGFVPSSINDPAVRAAEVSVVRGSVYLLPGSSVANLSSALAWLMTATNLPFIGLKREMSEVKALIQQAKCIPWEDLKQRTASSHLHPTLWFD